MKFGNFRLGAAALAVIGSLAAPVQAETIKLRVSTGFPSVHDVVTGLITPWVEDVSKMSGYDIDVELFAAGSAFGALDRQLTQVQKGLVDAAMGLGAVPRGRNPHLQLLDLPFLASDSRVLQAAADDIWADIEGDFPGVRLVGVSVDCSVLHTVSTPVTSLEDLKGLNLRVPSAATASMLASVGGVPVTMPQSEIYESLQRNVIDGAITPWDVVESLKLGEVMKYHGNQMLFCGQLWFGLNQKTYDKLPDAVKTAIGELDRIAYAERAQAMYEASRSSAKAFAQAEGGEIIDLPEDQMAIWKEKAADVVEQYLVEAEKAGVADIRDTYARLTAAIEAREAE